MANRSCAFEGIFEGKPQASARLRGGVQSGEIAALPYTAISQGWGWGNPPAPPESRANRITHNRIFNFMRRVDDGGGIYTTDRQTDSEIAFNFIDRMFPPDPETKSGGALYPDQYTEGFHIHHNVVAESTRWLYLWNPNIRGNVIEHNFADTARWRNDGPDNRVEVANVSPDRRWPDEARAIIDAGGIEPEFAHAREFLAPAEIVVESTSVDFQIFRGEWVAADALSDRYGATHQESTDFSAAARWRSLVPMAGIYEISMFRPAGSAEPEANKHSAVKLRAATSADWEHLGEYRFRPGVEVEVTIARDRTDTNHTLRADAIRFAWRQP